MYLRLEVIGHLGENPEMRYTPSGDPVTSFSVASTRTWIGNDGQKHEKTTWVNCTAWRKTAELAAEYLKKGSKVFVAGDSVESKSFTRRDGSPGSSLELTVERIVFLNSKNEAISGGNESTPAQPNQKQQLPSEDDIPF